MAQRDRLMDSWLQRTEKNRNYAISPIKRPGLGGPKATGVSTNVLKKNPRQGQAFQTFTKQVGGKTVKYHEYNYPGGKRKVFKVGTV